MSDMLGISGDLASASAALSGLLLVFLGAIANSYEAFDGVSKKVVVNHYWRRAMLVAVGFFSSLLASIAAILGKWLAVPCLVAIALAAFFLSLLVISIAALLTVRDIS